jgi:hypothetical protein
MINGNATATARATRIENLVMFLIIDFSMV